MYQYAYMGKADRGPQATIEAQKGLARKSSATAGFEPRRPVGPFTAAAGTRGDGL